MQPEVEQSIHAAIDVLKSLGAEIREVSLPHTDYGLPVYYIIAPAEASANLARFDSVRYGLRIDRGDLWETYRATRGEGFGPEVKRRIILGTYVLSSGYYDAYYGRAQKVRTLIRRDFETAFQQVDAILSPVAPTPGRKIGAFAHDPLHAYLTDIFTLSANLAGIPGISVPCGLTDFDGGKNLPVGLQILGPHLGEAKLLQIAQAAEG
jgi:aspartyl-tRNA(Asn)/glutamyl-tRNA(Gln) amidotransferase subunit A